MNQPPSKAPHFDTLDIETQRCLDSLNYLIRYKGTPEAAKLVQTLTEHLHDHGQSVSTVCTTPYLNTIPVSEEPVYPGDETIEEDLELYMRWNAVAMVLKANKKHEGLGGHISTYASSATLYEVGFNHFFKGNAGGHEADMVYFQGHASPGNYARSFLEGRLSEKQLGHFRQELAEGGGLSSYPHPYLMPDYWQFPTVSMGLGPIMSIYQARFNKYLISRNLIPDHDQHVWCFIGDGETDEPETLGALSIAGREGVDNLIFVVNCNLQRLDGPVRGNGKVIQDLEGVFRGAGWNVIKVVWSSDWDPLLKSPQAPLLIQRMNEAVDGEFQKYVVEPGSYMRKHFFGKYPELLELVSHLSDDQLKNLARGGHDRKKVYAAYKRAVEHKGQPTVILAKTVKGYGLGEAAEGKNIAHQQKKLTEKELRGFRSRFKIDLDDDVVTTLPFLKPPSNSPEHTYLMDRRKALGGFLPERKVEVQPMALPASEFYTEFLGDSGDNELSTTMAFVRILSKLLRDPGVAKHIVPIIPDEGRTFGMESLFRQIGIYSPKGQLYEPVDSDSILYYKEAKDGQILEEGINEAGAISSFLAAGTSYATHGINMIPFYIYYSMFGFQRIGDSTWLAGDMGAKGFLLGGTAGRTTLNGEGLQHQDGHSLLLASTIPNCVTYDTTFRFELAVILEDALKRMYQDGESVYYYLTLGNENYPMPAMPATAKEGILKGLYAFSTSELKKPKHRVQLFGSGTILREAIKAAEILEKDHGIAADVWGATNYKRLRHEAVAAQRWNMLHPTEKPQASYLETTLAGIQEAHPDTVFVAVSDSMRIVPDQIAPWVPGGLFSLGTDGFGRSETREALRRFFEVDAASIVVAVLYQLARKGRVTMAAVQKAIVQQGLDPEKVFPIVL
ncbi:MAG: pyruvate dehydrogenase (acetyl-transferring), homodimeric type [Candidatus Margulisiibacteriota bacterium]